MRSELFAEANQETQSTERWVKQSSKMLRINAERRVEERTEKQGFTRHEMRYGSFTRTLPLAEGATEDDIRAALREAGLPPALTHSLLVGSADAAALITHPLVQGVSFTGSRCRYWARARRRPAPDKGRCRPVRERSCADIGRPGRQSCCPPHCCR